MKRLGKLLTKVGLTAAVMAAPYVSKAGVNAGSNTQYDAPAREIVLDFANPMDDADANSKA